nr:sulfotransferase family 2 domain-containing protein [uncultured Hyphomonas sp.]
MKYKNFIYNEKSNTVFAYVPKVACTNWKSLLRYMAGHENWLDNKLAHDKQNGGLNYLDIEGSDRAILNRPGLKKFAMVRDPYSRVLSAYLNKVESRLPPKPEGEGDHFDKIVRDIDVFRRNVLGEGAYPGINLEVFLRWLDHGASWFTKDEHWAPQHILLRQPEMKFDFIGKLENLEQDSARILDSMDCDQRFPSQKDVNFAPTGAQSKTDKYFNTVTRRLVERIYAEDFQYFDYAYDSGTKTKYTQTPSTHSGPLKMSDSILPKKPAVNERISPNDWMWKGDPDRERYLSMGWRVARSLVGAVLIAGTSPQKIVDFGCGHGRILRWLQACFPGAELVAADREVDAVEFCADTFGATRLFSNPTFDDLGLGENNDLIWLGSVYTHLPMPLWEKLTHELMSSLSPEGLLCFSVAGPFVARKLEGGERNPNAEVKEAEFNTFLADYKATGFGYADHSNVGDRQWGRSIISHERLIRFLHDMDLEIVMFGERLYANRQDIVVVRRKRK